MRSSHRVLVAALALTLSSCETRELAIEVTPGQETGSFSADPAVANVLITVSSPDGEIGFSVEAGPGESFDLGDVPDNALLNFDLAGKDAGGTIIARGRSVGVPIGAFQDEGPLRLFLQRLGAFARPPGHLVTSHLGGTTAILGERYVLLTGGEVLGGTEPTSADVDVYDFLTWGPAQSPTMPRTAKSLVSRDTRILLIDDEGATWVDLSLSETSDATWPEEVSFAEIAGGRAIESPDGTTYIVGATRDGESSAGVLAIDADGNLAGKRLTAARAGAAAAWADEVGLVIVGGHDTAPGVEIVPAEGSTRTLGYPPDPSRGRALVAIDGGRMLLVGGVVPTPETELGLSLLDPACVGTCALEDVDPAAIPLRSRAQAYRLGTGDVLSIGDDVDAETRAFLVKLDGSPATELALREPRFRASVSPAPNGTLAILGGENSKGEAVTSVELFFPE